jgi:hypothetical protein
MEKDDAIRMAEEWKNRVKSIEKNNRNDVKLYLEYFQSIESRLNSAGYSTNQYTSLAESLI